MDIRDKFSDQIEEIRIKSKETLYFYPHTVVVRFLLKRLDEAQSRMDKMEMLLDMFAPDWEAARIMSDKPMMTEEECKDVFGDN